jgi:D-alanyl-D-alanine dipeptidase
MISISEPVSQLRKIKIVENDEPLVDFLQICPLLELDQPQFNYRRETLIRQSVADKLCKAAELLPKGIIMAVLEGWRAPIIQQRMYQTMFEKFKLMHPTWTEVGLRRETDKFVAPSDLNVPAPHTTGGALDLALIGSNGTPLDTISPYAANDSAGFPLDAPELSEVAKRNREILVGVLKEVDLTNYPSEYWHFSFGDQGWAYRGSHGKAIYGMITPVGWKADPQDIKDEPLIVVAGKLGRASTES